MLKQREYKQDYNNGCHSYDAHSSHTSNARQSQNATQFAKISGDRMTFADDAGLGYTNHNEIPIKLITYNDTADPPNFLVSLGNVFVLIGKDGKKPSNY